MFSAEFARRLDSTCRLHVKEAADGDALVPGWVHIAPGNFHMRVRNQDGAWHALVGDGPKVHFRRPAVDILFESVAQEAGRGAIGVILTGMGADGAAGMLKMKQAGATTIAQNEASCVVFGMPREAIRACAVDDILPLDQIAGMLTRIGSLLS